MFHGWIDMTIDTASGIDPRDPKSHSTFYADARGFDRRFWAAADFRSVKALYAQLAEQINRIARGAGRRFLTTEVASPFRERLRAVGVRRTINPVPAAGR